LLASFAFLAPWSVQFRKHMNVGIGYLHVGILNAVAFRSSQPGAAFCCFRVVREANMTLSPGGVAARTASGHAAAPPSSVMNSRRLNRSYCIKPPTSQVQDIELAMVSQRVSG